MFDEACFNIPTLGGLYKIAALDAITTAARRGPSNRTAHSIHELANDIAFNRTFEKCTAGTLNAARMGT